MSLPCLTGNDDPIINKVDEAYRVKALVYLNGAIAALTQNGTYSKDIEIAQEHIISAKCVLANWWDIKQRTNGNDQQQFQADSDNKFVDDFYKEADKAIGG